MIISQINSLLRIKNYVIIAVDGRCAAGKTTLSKSLKEALSCNVIHMDHFFLRQEQRTKERLSAIGGNIDYERFLTEVIPYLKNNESFSYRPFDCHTMSYGEPIEVTANKITVVEGSYSCHPKLWDFFDLHIFLDIDSNEQLKRIADRNGINEVKKFKELWIPLEEKYFMECNIKERCNITIKNGRMNQKQK